MVCEWREPEIDSLKNILEGLAKKQSLRNDNFWQELNKIKIGWELFAFAKKMKLWYRKDGLVRMFTEMLQKYVNEPINPQLFLQPLDHSKKEIVWPNADTKQLMIGQKTPSEDNNIQKYFFQLNDERISDEHCSIIVEDNKYVLKDKKGGSRIGICALLQERDRHVIARGTEFLIDACFFRIEEFFENTLTLKLIHILRQGGERHPNKSFTVTMTPEVPCILGSEMSCNIVFSPTQYTEPKMAKIFIEDGKLHIENLASKLKIRVKESEIELKHLNKISLTYLDYLVILREV